MGALPFPHPPVLTASTLASPLLRLTTLFDLAPQTGVDGIDLDLTGRPALPSAAALVALINREEPSIRSVWVTRGTPWSRSREPWASNLAVELALAAGADRLVAELPVAPPGQPSRPIVTGLVESLRARVGADLPVALAIPARRLVGGRSHLVQLTALRRLAEEWEFELALDLRGAIDPRWEAEAAIDRLGPRLTLIRLGTDVAGGPITGPYRILRRVTGAALGREQRVVFALVPTGPPWHRLWPAALAESCRRAGDYLHARYAAVEEQWLDDTSFPSRPHSLGSEIP
jgi:hypothetical protein